jgi:hypothetical protein
MPVSTQIGSVKRHEIPCFAGSDIFANTLVKLANTGDWTVVPVTSLSDEPLGFARDNASPVTTGGTGVANAVSVFDYGNIVRPIAGASITQNQIVGYAGASSTTHPLSGLVATFPYIGPVTGHSGSACWGVGPAFEQANPGEEIAVRINPRQLSGLS